MNIRGLSKTSLVDYPGKISAVIFTGSCNMRCPFCHNPELALGSSSIPVIAEDEVLAFLDQRKGLIDGVTITGGEPALQKDLIDFMVKIKERGFLVKLDSNGLMPTVISRVLSDRLVDYVAIDIKSSPGNYSRATGIDADCIRVRETVDLLRASGIDYEVRTTCVPGFVDSDDIIAAGEYFGPFSFWYLQQFVNRNTMIDPSLGTLSPYPVEYMKRLQDAAAPFCGRCVLRGI